MLTYVLVALLAAFGVGDTVAHLTRYRYGKTFSALIWAIEKRWPLFRIPVAAATLTLFTHLVFQTP